MNDKEIWVLTECYEDFDDYRDYYVRAFIGKPSATDLVNSDEGVNGPTAKRLLETGKSSKGLHSSHMYYLIRQDGID